MAGLGKTAQQSFAYTYNYSGQTHQAKGNGEGCTSRQADDSNSSDDEPRADHNGTCVPPATGLESQMDCENEPHDLCTSDEDKGPPQMITSRLQEFGLMTAFQWLPYSKPQCTSLFLQLDVIHK